MDFRDATSHQTRAAAEGRAAAHRAQVAAGTDAGSRVGDALSDVVGRWGDRRSRRRRLLQFAQATGGALR